MMKMRKSFFLVFISFLGATLAAPNSNGFVVSSTEPSKEDVKNEPPRAAALHPIIYEMGIKSNISNRFATTLVISKVKNEDRSPKETTFTVVLPEKAFISEFVMEIGGKSYKAYVKGKEEAKNIYDKAVSSGQSAGHVAVSARDSNRFTVSVNVEPESKAVFLLTYEELLERRSNQYELVLNIHPGQIVKNLYVEVQVNESRPLKFVRTPSLRSGNEVAKNQEKLDPFSDVKIINSTSAVVKFHPDTEKQKQFARDLGGKEYDGVAGQFVVQYDVERDPYGGEILLNDGYFVHFFAPEDLEALPKHAVFVLDTSGSMYDRKINQLKDAMYSILSQLNIGDVLSIIEFDSSSQVWNIVAETPTPSSVQNYEEPFDELARNDLPGPVAVNNDTITKAKNVIGRMNAAGGTNIISALETALYLVKSNQEISANTAEKYQPIIIFLTDGEPNFGIYSTESITRIVTRLNSANNKIPIFSLSFGYGADKSFLRKLSLKNQGFSRHIYEASDASLQLQDFYKQISSPLLSNINFKYDSEVKDVTKISYPIFFKGSELVVSGRYEGSLVPSVVARGQKGMVTLKPKIEQPVSTLERLWAYLTVKETLERRDSAENKTELTKKALDLALKYSFVTDVSSLVVVKPNDTKAVDTEEASGTPSGGSFAPISHRTMSGLPSSGQSYGLRGVSSPRLGSALYIPSYSSGMNDLGSRSIIGPYRVQSLHAGVFGRGPYFMRGPPSITMPPAFTTSTTPKPQTSTASVPVSQPATKHPLENSLPWLTSALNPNGSLTISERNYELGDNSLATKTKAECPTTPLNGTETGYCTLLKECPQVFTYLTDFQVYRQYFCPVELKYAGICCPKKINQL